MYNCRCTLIAALADAPKAPNPLRRARDPETGKSILVSDMTYAQWESWKKSENRYVWDTYIKKGKKLSSDRAQWAEYKSVLGKNVPGTLDSFQNLKYNEPEKWARLKTDKRQTDFVNNAPCVTTPKKFTGYFLKSGAKHADQFFNVGYTEKDVLQLQYDIARQFDMSKAVDISENNDGSTKFNIYMKLGVTKERIFCTGWRIDKPGDAPRIITAFRSERGQKMLNEYDKVRIKTTGIIGEIVDIYTTADGITKYTVESDEKGVPGGWGEPDSWKLFDCVESDLEKVEYAR